EHGGIKISIYMQPGLASSGSAGAEPRAATAESKAAPGGDHSRDRELFKEAIGDIREGHVAAQRLSSISAEAGRVIDFLTKTLGPPPAGSSFTVISSVRAGNFAVPGALILSESVLRQDTLDATTIELLADALARIWIDGRVRVRGQDARSAQVDQPAQKA